MNMKGHKIHNCLHIHDLLGVFAELKKSFVLSACLSIIIKRLDSHRTEFRDLKYVTIPRKSVEYTHL
jgi:hypothetical protein